MQRRSERPAPAAGHASAGGHRHASRSSPADPDGRPIPHCLTGADSRFGSHCRAHARADSRFDAHRHAHAHADRHPDARRLAHARADSHPGSHRHGHARTDSPPTPCPPTASPEAATSTAATAATGTGLVSREDLGIREVDTAEALAAAGLRYVRCAAGEIVSQEVGLYLLDVQTGAVEGWVLASVEAAAADSMDGFVSAGVSLSPGNRFLSFDRFQHDRVTDRTFEWDAPPLRRWGSDSERRLLFRLADEGGDRFVITDGTLQPVAQFAIPDGQEGQLQWLNFEYRSLVVRGRERDGGLHSSLHFFDFSEEAVGTFEPAATQVLPGDAKAWSEGLYRLASLGPSIEVAIAGPDSCHVMHYGWDGATLLDVSVPVVPLYGGRDCRISPDGHWMTAVTGMGATGTARGARLMAVSILDTTTGDEVYRVKGVDGPGRWLPDSSGVSMSTSRGTRFVTLDGQWASEAPRPASVSAKPAPAIADSDARAEAAEVPDQRHGEKGHCSRSRGEHARLAGLRRA